MPDVQEALQAILKAINIPVGEPPKIGGRVVCVSRDYGAGGDEVAGRLAKRLGVGVYDQQVLEKITQRLNTDKATMTAVENGVSRLRDLWLYSLMTGADVKLDSVKHHLVNVVLSIARTGGVILGRGAHLILANSGALRVRFTGSVDVCARRVAAAEGLDLAAAKKKVEETNARRDQFLWETFHRHLADDRTFDLVINTDRIGDNDKLVDLLVEAMNMVKAVPAELRT